MPHPESPPQAKNLVGTVVNGHEILRPLGAGAMGEVYVVRHQQLGILRALKVVHDDIKGNPSAVARFEREAIVLGRLRHPNIVDVVEYGQLENGWPYLILEYIDGGNLHDYLAAQGRVSVMVALEMLLQLGHVLQYAHAQGVIHRDLKPGNILLRGGDHRQLKVIDFGLAKLISARGLTRLTADGLIMGTPEFMSPEQAAAEREPSGAVDVYAIAGVAYLALSGQSVFPERGVLGLIYAHVNEVPERLSARTPVPAGLDELLYRCLAKEPAARPAADELVAELEALVSSHDRSRLDWLPTAPFRVGNGDRAQVGSFVAMAPDYPTLDDQRVEMSPSMMREQEVASGADYIFAPIPVDEHRPMREAMRRQMLAVVSELSDALGTIEPDVAERRQRLSQAERQLADIEIERALVWADFADGGNDEARQLVEERYANLGARALALRRYIDSEQRELAIVVDRHRERAGVAAAALFAELDDMIVRARSLGRWSG